MLFVLDPKFVPISYDLCSNWTKIMPNIWPGAIIIMITGVTNEMLGGAWP